MTQKRKHTTQKRKGMGEAVAAGAIAGAAIGAAAGAILSDKKTRHNIGDKLGELKDQAIEATNRVLEEVEPLGDEVKGKLQEGKRKKQKED